MELLVLILCVLVTAADGNRKVTVEEGKDVVLPCSLSSEENLQSELFDWKKDAHMEVFMYDAGLTYGNGFTGQDQQFEGRVSYFPLELKKGNASIKITQTKVSDSGTYSCIFPRLEPRQTFSVELLVGACPKPSAKNIMETNDQAVLQCVVQGPSTKLKVEWWDSSGKILQAEETKTGDSHSIILQTTVYKSDNYSCVVTQEDICHQVRDALLVHLPGSPVGWIVAVVLGVVVFVVVVVAVTAYFKIQTLQGQNRTLQGQNQTLKEEVQFLKGQTHSQTKLSQQPDPGVL